MADSMVESTALLHATQSNRNLRSSLDLSRCYKFDVRAIKLVQDNKVDAIEAPARLEQLVVEMIGTFDVESQKMAVDTAPSCCCIDLVALNDGKSFLVTEMNCYNLGSQAIEPEKYCSRRRWDCMMLDDLLEDWTSKLSQLGIAKRLMEGT